MGHIHKDKLEITQRTEATKREVTEREKERVRRSKREDTHRRSDQDEHRNIEGKPTILRKVHLMRWNVDERGAGAAGDLAMIFNCFSSFRYSSIEYHKLNIMK